MFVRSGYAGIIGALAAGLLAIGAAAQQPKQYTADDYGMPRNFWDPT
jgi:hypothetical protein